MKGQQVFVVSSGTDVSPPLQVCCLKSLTKKRKRNEKWEFGGTHFGSSWKYRNLSSAQRTASAPRGISTNLDHCSKMSEDVYRYEFNATNFWNSREGAHKHFDSSESNILPSPESKPKLTNYFMNKSSEACLVLTVPPESRFRYRYDTEMSGTHGSLQGIRLGKEKSVPTVKLLNYPHEALIRITLVTCQAKKGEHYPHPHSLFVKEKLYQKEVYENWDKKCLTKTGHYPGPHYIRVGAERNDFTARFEGMCIINSKKENFHASVREKLLMRLHEQKYGTHKNLNLRIGENEELADKIEEAVSSIDVDFVSLCFEAFREESDKLYSICPPIYSEPIGNAKSAKTGKLKISRINKCSGSCRGGEEIWMLVEKINKKGLMVRFWEELNGKTIWQSSLEGDDLILHHQYAIIFKTPPYKDVSISSEAEVLMRLERTTHPNQPCDFSEPITFVYEPFKNKSGKESKSVIEDIDSLESVSGDHLYRKESILTSINDQFHIKRARTDCSPLPSLYNHLAKCNGEDLEFGINCENSNENYIEQLLLNDKDPCEFDQAWAKFNVEEFLQFLSSEDVDMPLQRDGVSIGGKPRRDLMYKLCVLYSKLDENEIKKLTDDVSNFGFLKKEIQSNKSSCNVEKEQVKDAASTLLSLRSRARTNNNNSYGSKKNEGNKKLRNVLLLNNSEKPNSNPESGDKCNESDSDVPNPIHTSVIKNHSSMAKKENVEGSQETEKEKKQFIGNAEEKKFLIEQLKNFDLITNSTEKIPTILERKEKLFGGFNSKTVKKEVEVSDRVVDVDKLDSICQILNESGSWKKLADMWNCSYIIPGATISPNPSKYIFQHVEKLHGGLDPKVLRYLLDAVNEKKALLIFEEI